MSNKNKISQDDKDWLDVISGKPVENANPKTLQEANFLREALLRKHYEETTEPQPIKLGDDLAKRFQKEAPLPQLPPPFWKKIIQKAKTIWEQILENPIPVMATACVMMLLHIPLYLSTPQQSGNVLIPRSAGSVLIAKSIDSAHKDSRSHKVPLVELEEFVFQLHILGTGTNVTPQAGGRWLLQFTLDPEQLDEKLYTQFYKFLDSKNQPLPSFNNSLDVELLFIPLIQGKPVETYSYPLSNAPPKLSSPIAFANHIQQQFESLGVKAKVGQQGKQVTIDLWFPQELSLGIEEAMDEYGGMNKILLTSEFRQFRLNITDK